MNINMPVALLTPCVVLNSPLLLAQANQQAGLEEVTVTADRKVENLQDVSISVAAISGDTLREQGLTDIPDILKNVPSTLVVDTARGSGVSIRGTGVDLPPQVGELAVSLNFDGVYSFRSEAAKIGYYDIERIEVLRGPQGTLYGRNAVAGVVNIITQDPVLDEFAGRVTVELGDYNLKRGDVSLNIPVSEKWAVRAAVASVDRDGYLSDGHDDAVGTSLRLKSLYQASDDFKLVLKGEITKLSGKGPGRVLISSFAAGDELLGNDAPGSESEYFSERYSAHLEWNVGPGTLTVIPSYQHDEGDYWQYDAAVDGLVYYTDPEFADSKILDVRYAVKADSGIDWVAGVFYYDQSDKGSGLGGAQNDVVSTALYGQITYPLSDSLRLIAGLRSGTDKKNYSDFDFGNTVPSSGAVEDSTVDWRLGAEWDVADKSLVYFSAATGHRPGGFNVLADENASLAEPGSFFEDESLIAYEVGTKNRFYNDRLQVNGALFHYDYKDYQLTDIYAVFPTLAAQFVNGDASISGAEIQVQTLVGPEAIIDMAVTYLATELQETVAVGFTNLLKGDDLAHAPEVAVRFGYEQGFNLDIGHLVSKIDLRYTADQYLNTENKPANFQESYVSGDFTLLFNPVDSAWSVSAYVKNFTNKVVQTFTVGSEANVSSPRTFGVSATVNF